MPLYQVIKADGTKEEITGAMSYTLDGRLVIVRGGDMPYDLLEYRRFDKGTWTQYWKLEGKALGV